MAEDTPSTPPEDGSVAGTDASPHDGGMLEQRVTRLEDDMAAVKGILGRLEPLIVRMDERLNHMATKAELQEVRTEIKEVRTEIQEVRTEVQEVRTEVAANRIDMSHMATKDELREIHTELVANRAEMGRMATKDDLQQLRGEFQAFRVDVVAALAEKPSKLYLWGVLTLMVTALVAAIFGAMAFGVSVGQVLQIEPPQG